MGKTKAPERRHAHGGVPYLLRYLQCLAPVPKGTRIIAKDVAGDYIVNIVHATREPKAYGLGELSDFIGFGASPRASIYLNLAARAHAFLRHRGYVTPEDIKAVGIDVLRHRVILTYEAEAEEVTSETVIRKLFERVEVP